MNFEICKKCIGECSPAVVLECEEKSKGYGDVCVRIITLGILDESTKCLMSKCNIYVKANVSVSFLGEFLNYGRWDGSYYLKRGMEASFFNLIDEAVPLPSFLPSEEDGDNYVYHFGKCPYLFEHELYDWNLKQ